MATERVRSQSTVREDHIFLGTHAEPADRAVCVPEGKKHPTYPSISNSLSARPPCTGAADKQPGNHFLPGKVEGEAKMSTKTEP